MIPRHLTCSLPAWGEAGHGHVPLRTAHRQERARSVHVLASRAELAQCAERIARAWSCSVEVTPPAKLGKRIKTALALPSATVLVVGLRADLSDELLLDMLASLQRFIASGEPWESVPELTLLTGRDVQQVTGLFERLLAPASRPGAPARFVHAQPGAEATDTIELERHPGFGERTERNVAKAERLVELLRRPATAIAYQTHGGEACARGGGGVVLCGRSVQPVAQPAGTAGVLACGRELPCPRGPLPLPLREVSAQLLLLASCNGLRFVDGALTEDFNLGLSFLDGPGRAYVSSISGIRGNDLASRIFLAAVSSGASLGEATALINTALARTGTDVPRFVAVGSPTFVASPDRARPTPIRVTPNDAGVLELDAGDEHFIDVLIEDERTHTLVDEHALLLSDLEGGTEVLWFSRPELVRADGGGGLEHRVRLFLFQFPGSLGKLRLQVSDRRDTSNEALRWLAALARWLELWRTFGLAERQPEAYAELRAAYDDAGATMSRLLGRLGWSTTGRALVDAQCALIRSLSQVVSAELSAELAARLRATFWLPNEDATSYQLQETGPHVCNACGRPGIERRVRNPVTGHARRFRSCGRCGIVFDGHADGHLRELKLRTPEVVPRGTRFFLEVEVDVEPAAVGQTLTVHPRLSTHVVDQVCPEPAQAEVLLESAGRHVLTFTFDVPASLVPHQHFVKVIAATEQELAFASRILFVE